MAEVFVSPGVYTQEMDDTFSPPPGAAAIGAALVGMLRRVRHIYPLQLIPLVSSEIGLVD
jgi:hypothetical protein